MTEIKLLTGNDAAPFFDDLARLRIQVFHDFPYLYQGSRDYEKTYLSTYAKSAGALFVLAMDGDTIVGASTGMPMLDETPDVQDPFIAAGYDPAKIFYFGESVLLPDYRGQGIGVRFFEEREAYARALGLMTCTFCAVDRPMDHPRRPKTYVPLDAFWHKRGYVHHPELVARFFWQDLDETEQSAKTLTFWIKELCQ